PDERIPAVRTDFVLCLASCLRCRRVALSLGNRLYNPFHFERELIATALNLPGDMGNLLATPADQTHGCGLLASPVPRLVGDMMASSTLMSAEPAEAFSSV